MQTELFRDALTPVLTDAGEEVRRFGSHIAGQIGELAFAQFAILNNYEVCFPLGSARYDVAINKPNKPIVKIQVKTIIHSKNETPRLKTVSTGYKGITEYRQGDYDILAGYDQPSNRWKFATFDEVAYSRYAVQVRNWDSAEKLERLYYDVVNKLTINITMF